MKTKKEKNRILERLTSRKKDKLFCNHNKDKPCKECLSRIFGDVSGISGNVSGISGNVSGISGNVTGISGNIPGIFGDEKDIIKILKKILLKF